MIDKISAFAYLPGKIPPLLEQSLQYDKTNKRTGEIIYSGHLSNMMVTLIGNKVLFNGSLTKFHHGNNLINPLYPETREAVENISNALEIYPEDIYLKGGIEIAFNMLMDKKPIEYEKKMFSLKEWDKRPNTKDKTLSFVLGDSKIFKIYDKAADYHRKDKKNASFDKSVKNQNLLRAELVLKRLWQNKLPYSGAQTLKSITQPEQLRKIIQIYSSISEEIQFMRNFDPSFNERIKSGELTKKELKKLIFQKGLTVMKEEGVDLNKWIDSQEKSRQMKARDRKELRPSNNVPGKIASEEEKEFREKLSEKVNNYRESISE